MIDRHYRGFGAGQRPPVEVCIGDQWLQGELRAWILRGDTWWAHLDYLVPGAETHTTTVPSQRVRSDDPRAAAPLDSVGSADA